MLVVLGFLTAKQNQSNLTIRWDVSREIILSIRLKEATHVMLVLDLVLVYCLTCRFEAAAGERQICII